MRVVAEGFAHVRKPVDIARSKNKASSQLKRIFAQTVLPHADGLRPFTRPGIIPTQQMKEVCLLECKRLVGLALIVNEERERDPCLFAEMAGVADVSEANCHQFDAALTELLLIVTQLRDVLAAENSTVVTQENDDRRRVGPQRAETNGVPIHIGQSDLSKLAAIAIRHGASFSGRDGSSVKAESRIACARLPRIAAIARRNRRGRGDRKQPA